MAIYNVHMCSISEDFENYHLISYMSKVLKQVFFFLLSQRVYNSKYQLLDVADDVIARAIHKVIEQQLYSKYCISSNKTPGGSIDGGFY